MLAYGKIFILLFVIKINHVSSQGNELEGAKMVEIIIRNHTILDSLHEYESLERDVKFITDPTLNGPNRLICTKNCAGLFSFLSEHGLKYQIITNDLGRVVNKFMAQAKSFTSYQSGKVDVRNYHDYHDYMTIIQMLEKNSKGKMKIYSIGETYENRDIPVIVLPDNANSTKPIVLIECGIHAREWLSPAFCLWLLVNLLEQEENPLLKEYEFQIVPLANIDGYVFTWTGNRMWRKNRRPVSRYCRGVDLNRNWAAGWRSLPGCGETFSGKSAFSEPETMALSKHYKKISKRTLVYYAIHAYSQMWMYPYGHISVVAPNQPNLHKVSKAAVEAIYRIGRKKYLYGSIQKVIYPAYGSSIDWVYLKAYVKYCFAIEMRDRGEYGFLMPPKYIDISSRELWAGIQASLKNMK